MKDWCLKHPVLTFLLIDKFITLVYNFACTAKEETFAEEIARIGGEVSREAKNIIREVEKTEDRTIGFKVS